MSEVTVTNVPVPAAPVDAVVREPFETFYHRPRRGGPGPPRPRGAVRDVLPPRVPRAGAAGDGGGRQPGSGRRGGAGLVRGAVHPLPVGRCTTSIHPRLGAQRRSQSAAPPSAGTQT